MCTVTTTTKDYSDFYDVEYTAVTDTQPLFGPPRSFINPMCRYRPSPCCAFGYRLVGACGALVMVVFAGLYLSNASTRFMRSREGLVISAGVVCGASTGYSYRITEKLLIGATNVTYNASSTSVIDDYYLNNPNLTYCTMTRFESYFSKGVANRAAAHVELGKTTTVWFRQTDPNVCFDAKLVDYYRFVGCALLFCGGLVGACVAIILIERGYCEPFCKPHLLKAGDDDCGLMAELCATLCESLVALS
jgi:hypothetical protein